jgi:hypothetical protein
LLLGRRNRPDAEKIKIIHRRDEEGAKARRDVLRVF